MQGVVKVYDPETGIGIIRRDDGDEVLLQPGSLEGSLFRMLRQGQRVVFDATERRWLPSRRQSPLRGRRPIAAPGSRRADRLFAALLGIITCKYIARRPRG